MIIWKHYGKQKIMQKYILILILAYKGSSCLSLEILIVFAVENVGAMDIANEKLVTYVFCYKIL